MLAIGIIPALGYTRYYSTKYTTKKYYNTGSYSTKYYYYYRNIPTTRPVPQPSQPSKPTQPTTPTQPAPAPTTPSNPAPSSGLTAEESKMVNLVNQARTGQGVKPLSVNSQLVTLARRKSQDMVDKNYFSHTSPTYGSPFEMMKSAGVKYSTAGENIAGAATTESAHQNLMNSPGHRANILNSSFTQIGIGIVSGSQYGKMFTQMFIGL
ncbi:MAG: hypothetical protein GXY86_15105 [Firmicutes bacterium]|nr:hypothetical protein [Bacillota bacterium]